MRRNSNYLLPLEKGISKAMKEYRLRLGIVTVIYVLCLVSLLLIIGVQQFFPVLFNLLTWKFFGILIVLTIGGFLIYTKEYSFQYLYRAFSLFTPLRFLQLTLLIGVVGDGFLAAAAVLEIAGTNSLVSYLIAILSGLGSAVCTAYIHPILSGDSDLLKVFCSTVVVADVFLTIVGTISFIPLTNTSNSVLAVLLIAFTLVSSLSFSFIADS